MNRISHNFMKFVLAMIITMVSVQVMADKSHGKVVADSITIRTSSWSEIPRGKMTQSAYPVKLMVKGNSLRVSTKHRQVLPIYTQGGSLYLAMRLNPGVNWLNGLPRGRYRINNRTINIR